VLLIDADMRRPRLHEILQTPNNWGLSSLLSEHFPLADLPLKSLVRETSVKGLSVLSSGPGIASVSQLLYSQRVEELMERLRLEFDFILVDTPPLLPVADARIFGRVADGAILVVRSGKTAGWAVVTAKELLQQDGIPLFGTLLNAWDIRNSRMKSGYGYYYESAGRQYGT
jgi:capsular exopolysaccharide synthesis family protein